MVKTFARSTGERKGITRMAKEGVDRPVVVRRILDLYCKAGGASMGLHRAFPDAEIVGVDIEPQPRYPFTFIRHDAMTFNLDGFDFIWSSPPCQRYSNMTRRWKGRNRNHPDLIAPTRDRLIRSGKTYVIENVIGSPLIDPVLLCGSMFGLKVRRHRLFETSFFILRPMKCNHRIAGRVVGVYGHAGGRSHRDGISFQGTNGWRDAMGIDWMTGNELAEAIPPAYSEWVGNACRFNHRKGKTNELD